MYFKIYKIYLYGTKNKYIKILLSETEGVLVINVLNMVLVSYFQFWDVDFGLKYFYSNNQIKKLEIIIKQLLYLWIEKNSSDTKIIIKSNNS